MIEQVRRPTRDTNDEGFTLVEVLVTVVILGMAVVTILAALATLQRSSDIQRSKTKAQSLILNAAEWTIDEGRNPYRYSACATEYFPASTGNRYTPLVVGSDPSPTNTSPIGMPHNADGSTTWDPATTLKVLVVGYWNGSAWVEDPSTRVATCQSLEADNSATFTHMQKIEITVTSPDGRANESLTVVKRGG